jgi:hypothetical protein
MRRATEQRVEEYEGLRLSTGEILGRAFLSLRLFFHIVVFTAGIVALRTWGPVEIQVRIDSLADVPVRSTRAAIATGWTQAAGLARTVERTLGWQSDSADAQIAPSSF